MKDGSFSRLKLKFLSKNPRTLSPFTSWTEKRQRDLIMENDLYLRLRHMEQAQVNQLFVCCVLGVYLNASVCMCVCVCVCVYAHH
jgi:hypothetical protein